MKRIFGAKTRLLVSVLALACILAVGGTMAYLFASTGVLTNTFAVAQLDTDISEPNSGTETDKKVSITNTGDSPAWVRARLLVSGIDPDDVVIESNESEAKAGATKNPDKLYLVMPDDTSWQNVTSYKELMNGEGWIYYTRALDGKTDSKTDRTENLLDGVVFGANLKDKAETITITVTHESVLAINTNPADEKPWETAFTNPAGSPANETT